MYEPKIPSGHHSNVKIVPINENKIDDNKILYSISYRTFKSIRDLISYYQTYDFSEIIEDTTQQIFHRLEKPLTRIIDIEQQEWYQSSLSGKQAEELLLGVSSKEQ